MTLSSLPSFDPKNRQLYHGLRESIDEFRGYQEKARLDPQDSAALDRIASGLERTLWRRKIAHGLETAGIVAAQAGGIGFVPCLLTGNSTAILASGGALLGGLVMYIGGIFTGAGDPRADIVSACSHPGDLDVVVRYRIPEKRIKELSRLESLERVETYRSELQSLTRPDPGGDEIVKGPEVVVVAGVPVPVRKRNQ
ncbi:MAG: hypothetical protein HY319_32520 [Armatimonadetes bacterium]|nr:hypothetical protein [Armatimonadota bacterium]